MILETIVLSSLDKESTLLLVQWEVQTMSFVSPSNLRSTSRSLLVCPSTFTKFYGARAFAAAAAELWNSLPDTIKQAQTVNLFKTKLKTHLFLQ